MKRILYLVFVLFDLLTYSIQAQVRIQMEEQNGVYRVPCVVNGLKLKFIFDTGASSVSISSTVANMMLENDYLSLSDIKGTGASQIANGQIVDHTVINLREIEIGGITLRNIEAVVIHEQSAPLLLGQTAIQKLGKVSISGNALTIASSNGSNPYRLEQQSFTQAELDNIYKEADSYRKAGNMLLAVEKYDIIYNNNYLYLTDLQAYALCLRDREVQRYDEALNVLLKHEEDVKQIRVVDMGGYYHDICFCAYMANEYKLCIKYGQLCQYTAAFPLTDYTSVAYWIASAYRDSGDDYLARRTFQDMINKYLNYMEISATDCWTKNYKDPILGDSYYCLYVFSGQDNIRDQEKYLIISAAWGYESAIVSCNNLKINYMQKPNNYVY